MRWSVSEMARNSGVSVRTLHYYDQIGLLCPETAVESGYRSYGAADVERMQQILFYKELDFSLKDIQTILADPQYDKQQALARQRHFLELKRARLDRLLALLDARTRGEAAMELKEFDRSELEQARREYAAEAKARWGHTDAWRASQEKTAQNTPADWSTQTEEMNAIFRRVAALRGQDPAAPEVQAVLADWQVFITAHYYPCTDEILAGLGELYLADARFRENLDRFGEGTAALLSAAIAVRCEA